MAILAICAIMTGCFNKKQLVDYERCKYLWRIDNPTLRECLVSFHNEFKDHESAKGKALEISCVGIREDTILYEIGYRGGFVFSEPVIFCEPIDGRPVVLTMGGLYNEFSMDMAEYIELMKATNPVQYQAAKEILNKDDIVMNGFVPEWTPASIDDFVSLRLVFDGSHNLIRIDTLGVH